LPVPVKAHEAEKRWHVQQECVLPQCAIPPCLSAKTKVVHRQKGVGGRKGPENCSGVLGRIFQVAPSRGNKGAARYGGARAQVVRVFGARQDAPQVVRGSAGVSW